MIPELLTDNEYHRLSALLLLIATQQKTSALTPLLACRLDRLLCAANQAADLRRDLRSCSHRLQHLQDRTIPDLYKTLERIDRVSTLLAHCRSLRCNRHP